jgi:glutaredoxin 3
MRQITVYTTDFCGYCRSAKTLLDRRQIAYEEINLSRDPDGREALSKVTGMHTFPQIVVAGVSIGGFNELIAADRAGRLQDLLAA